MFSLVSLVLDTSYFPLTKSSGVIPSIFPISKSICLSSVVPIANVLFMNSDAIVSFSASILDRNLLASVA